jgi:maleylacetate reductase
MEFLFTMPETRVLFGRGAFSKLKEEVGRLGCSAPLVLTTPSKRSRERIERALPPLKYELYDGARMHVPLESVEGALEFMKGRTFDCLAAVGGGSSIGLAKALALRTGLPIIAVPTTYAGSEMTPIWGITEKGVKTTGRDGRVLPKSVIYDPELFASLPASVAGVSAMNALAHCVEALYAENANPVTDLFAEDAIRLLTGNLGASLRGDDQEALESVLRGAWMGGMVLAMTTMGLHHKLCHTLGGTLDLPHAETHAVVLPHVIAFNREHAEDAMKKIARGFGVTTAFDAARAAHALLTEIGAKNALKDLGMKSEDIERIADLATRNKYYNPRPFGAAELVPLLENAYWGRPPV